MEKKCKTTINGHPILSIAIVQSWFLDAKVKTPSEAALVPLVRAINHIDLFQCCWRDSAMSRESRDRSPSRLAMIRVAASIKTICNELPDMIKFASELKKGDYDAYESLVSVAKECLPGLNPLLAKPKGRRALKWHVVARSLKILFRDAMNTTAGRTAGFSLPTSRGIPLMRSALLHLGIDAKEEQVVEALRLPRKRSRPAGK